MGVTDQYSKLVKLFPVSTTHTAAEVAQIFHDGWFRHHGLPESIISDRDSLFTGAFWKALHKKLGVELRMSTAAHLRTCIEDCQDDWATRLVDVEFGINSSAATATGLAPFEVAYGFLPTRWPNTSWSDTTDVPAADGFAERRRLNWLTVTDAIIGSRLEMAHQANKHRLPDHPEFLVGNKCYVDAKHIAFPPHLKKKFLPRFIGPYRITQAFAASSNYEIALPAHFKCHRRFHASKLRPHFANDDERFPGRAFDHPPPVDAADEAASVWSIEKVITHKFLTRSRKYLVRHLGTSASEDKWITEAELKDRAPEVLATYIASKGGALQVPATAARARARLD